MQLVKVRAFDRTGSIEIVFFNRPYTQKQLFKGREYIFYGKVTASRGCLEMSNPIIESPGSDCPVRPVYPRISALTSGVLQRIMSNAVGVFATKAPEDIIPDDIRHIFRLCHQQFAVKSIHFPSCSNDIEIARHRFIFEELLTLQLGMKRLKNAARKATEFTVTEDVADEFIKKLPFELTGAQKRAIDDALGDMKSGRAMNRLIQGDVGSGKTAVAACLLYVAAKNGFQSAFMAPTEILARQHYESLSRLLEGSGIEITLLTGSVTAAGKRKIKEGLKSGKISIAVGTHALLSDDVEFCRLGLAVTDEQHRFGVSQRGTLVFKGANPHTLVMSATPIPRTLSLIIYGDLDLTVIDELPKGRQKISTYCVDTSYRPRIYSFIKKHIDMGLQAYIVCPAVEENEEYEITSATEYYEKLCKNEFSSYKLGLLHGKMKAKDKERVMSDFLRGEIQLLISTTVIEVGVDVPNSVIMVIEDAERFGLSQLHQLRGRVGRGKEKSYCVLISNSTAEETKARLSVMCRTDNGFLIADEDLKIRGPGDFFGSRQHGLPDMKIADLTANMDIVRQTKKACDIILARDPLLSSRENRPLAEAVDRLFSEEKRLSLN